MALEHELVAAIADLQAQALLYRFMLQDLVATRAASQDDPSAWLTSMFERLSARIDPIHPEDDRTGVEPRLRDSLERFFVQIRPR